MTPLLDHIKKLNEAVAYVRVSTTQQETRDAPECQIRSIQAYADELGITLHWFQDVGSAFRKPIEKRPQAMAAIKKAQELGVPLIIDVPSRLARNGNGFLELIRRHNVRVISARGEELPPERLAAEIARWEAESQHKSDGLKRLYKERKAAGLGPLNPDLNSARKKGHKTSRRKALVMAHELDELVRSMGLEDLSAYMLEKVLAEQGLLRSDGGKWTEEVITSSRKRLNAEQEQQPKEISRPEESPPLAHALEERLRTEHELEAIAVMHGLAEPDPKDALAGTF